MYHGPMFNKSNTYYFDFKKQILIEHFNNTTLNEEEIKIISNDFQINVKIIELIFMMII